MITTIFILTVCFVPSSVSRTAAFDFLRVTVVVASYVKEVETQAVSKPKPPSSRVGGVCSLEEVEALH